MACRVQGLGFSFHCRAVPLERGIGVLHGQTGAVLSGDLGLYVYHSLNSLRGGYIGDYIGGTIGDIMGY